MTIRSVLLLLPLLHLPAAELLAERVPGGGIQPQAMASGDGGVHLIYFRGAETAGDLFYVHRDPGAAAFAEPLRVNSAAGSALSIGAIRGAQLALGRDGWVHVAWNGSQQAQPKGPEGSVPMLYARKARTATAFEAQRSVMTWAGGLDGGGTIAADAAGRVCVAWHAGPGGVQEAQRSVYLAQSKDDGRTFAKEIQAVTRPTGACACCAMRAGFDASGGIALLYRAAVGGMQRDMILAYAAPGAASFANTGLEGWALGTCPMSTSAIARAGDDLLVAWQGERGLSWTRVAQGRPGAAVAMPAGAGAKHPAIAQAADGAIAVVWTEGTGWKRGGSLHWQLYRADGAADGAPGRQDGVEVWSIPTVVATGPGRFAAWY